MRLEKLNSGRIICMLHFLSVLNLPFGVCHVVGATVLFQSLRTTDCLMRELLAPESNKIVRSLVLSLPWRLQIVAYETDSCCGVVFLGGGGCRSSLRKVCKYAVFACLAFVIVCSTSNPVCHLDSEVASSESKAFLYAFVGDSSSESERNLS